MTQTATERVLVKEDEVAPHADAARAELVVILLTFNSASVIERTVGAAKRLCERVAVVDSGSTDGTVEILERLGCEVVSRPFKNYSDQRNWAIEKFGVAATWQLHLDADEVLDDRAVASLRGALASPGSAAGFMLKRLTYFMGKPLRFGGASSWHLRLFRTGAVRCEDRLYDQHFVGRGEFRRLDGLLHDMNVGDITEWVNRHNRWASLESAELWRQQRAAGAVVEGKLSADPRERRRFYKGFYYRAPPFVRAIVYFLVRYVVQLGFLDGRVGFIYAFLQALWFRMLVDVKLAEMQERTSAQPAPRAEVPSTPDLRRP